MYMYTCGSQKITALGFVLCCVALSLWFLNGLTSHLHVHIHVVHVHVLDVLFILLCMCTSISPVNVQQCTCT